MQRRLQQLLFQHYLLFQHMHQLFKLKHHNFLQLIYLNLEAEDIEIRSSNTLRLGDDSCSSVDIYGTRIHGHGVTGNYFIRKLSGGSLLQRAYANSHCQEDLPT